jgi:iron-sulfur cluster assembly protein
MSIELTASAARRITDMMSQQDSSVGLRLGTRKSGCSGYAYVIELTDSVGESDVSFESGGVRIIVDRDSLPFLAGTTLDFVKTDMFNENFVFDNPNVQDACGCGESINFSGVADD